MRLWGLWAMPAMALTFGMTPAANAEDEVGSEKKKPAILEMLELPEAAHALRKGGVKDEEVKEALDAVKRGKPPAKDAGDTEADGADEAEEKAAGRAARVLKAEAEAVKVRGPKKGFGAFVKAKVEAGVRGRDLAAAIAAERAAADAPDADDGEGSPDGEGKPDETGKPEGKGKPEGAGEPDEAGKPEGKGKPEGAGKPDEAGKPEGKGKPEDAGKPDEAGKPEGKGKPEDAGKPDEAGKPEGKGKPEGAGKGRGKP